MVALIIALSSSDRRSSDSCRRAAPWIKNRPVGRHSVTTAPSSRARQPVARHVAYHALLLTLKEDPRLPVQFQGIRFFEVAATIAGPAGFGGLRRGTLTWLVKICALEDAVQYLTALSAWLLVRNLELAARMIEKRELRSPLTESDAPMTPLAFDEAMVVFEQNAVEAYLRQRPMGDRTRRGIDRLMAACANPVLRRFFGFDAALGEAIGRCNAQHAAAFLAIETRIAIGRDLVHRSHRHRTAAQSCEPPRRGERASWLLRPKRPGNKA